MQAEAGIAEVGGGREGEERGGGGREILYCMARGVKTMYELMYR